MVITASETHMIPPVDDLATMPEVLKTLSDPEYCTPKIMEARYPLTKRKFSGTVAEVIIENMLVVLNVLFVRALAEHLPASTPFTPTAVNPGFCLSDLRRDAGLGTRIQMKIMDIILGRTAEQGSRNLLWAALGPDGKEGPHLRYMRGAYVSCAGLGTT